MATLFANRPFDYRALNLSDTLDATGYEFNNNVFVTYNGIVYEDLYSLEFDFGSSYLTFAGHGITMAGDTITGGTVTGIIEEARDGSSFAAVWGVERINVGAVPLWNAAHTAGTADDFALIQGMLAGADTFFLSDGADRMRGYAGNDRLLGFAGADILYGDAGRDVLTGGLGGDRLFGGEGADIFDLDRVGESGLSSGSRDVIGDFQRGADRIDLRTIDANAAAGGDQAFSGFIGAARAFNAPGQLKFRDGVLYGNTDNDPAAEFAIRVTGVAGLSDPDVML
ncbi:M10 family metallopeptidase C-terminal domain-containing protein [Ramlibacter sp. PS3R-8]|uniref:calcium-binding protein n=1 Tax=Ramlibacter sp. PS3R-8 TaxID=3133437 RepID=UPI0030A22954